MPLQSVDPGTLTGCILTISSMWPSVLSKKNFRPRQGGVERNRRGAGVDRVQWNLRGSSTVAFLGRAPEEGRELAPGADVGLMRPGLQLAHAHAHVRLPREVWSAGHLRASLRCAFRTVRVNWVEPTLRGTRTDRPVGFGLAQLLSVDSAMSFCASSSTIRFSRAARIAT